MLTEIEVLERKSDLLMDLIEEKADAELMELINDLLEIEREIIKYENL